MIDRILEIQESGRFLHLDHRNIVIEQKGAIIARIPLEDVSVLVISTPSLTVSTPLIAALAAQGAPTILVGKNFQPIGEFFPVLDHTEVGTRIRAQAASSLPLKKTLWKSIVVQKLLSQSQILDFYGDRSASIQLKVYSKEVLSGDTTNREGIGARVYWQHLFGAEFRRDQDAPGVNALLNYAYAIVRSAALRAIWAAGILPYFGLNHSNRSNAGVLADDLMEPFRPLADGFVYEAVKKGWLELTPTTKQFLTRLLWFDMETARGTSPFSRALYDVTDSLVKAYQGTRKTLVFPTWSWEGGEARCSLADTKSCG